MKIVFINLHTIIWRDSLYSWLGAHPRTKWWRSGKGFEFESIAMSKSAWRRFCTDYGYDYKRL